MKSIALTGIGAVLSGDLDRPRLAGIEVILCRDGLIAAMGSAAELEPELAQAKLRLDLRGGTVAPGLIDSHGHVTFGDYSPRQRAVDYLESYVHGGITTTISAGEVHVPGRPRDRRGVMALAVAAHASFENFRPGGMRVHAGAVLIEPTLTEQDYAELAASGVWLAKFGFGAFSDPLDGIEHIRWARTAGMTVMCHAGGASAAGSASLGGDQVMALAPHVCGHANGGPTSLPASDVERLLLDSNIAMQVVQAGNLKAALHLVRQAEAGGLLRRVVIGSDTPSGFGVMPLGVLKTVVELASLVPLEPETAWALATGNTADVWRLPVGRVATGAPADLLTLSAPAGSQAVDAIEAIRIGDIPAITAVVTDGIVRAAPGRNSPRARTAVQFSPAI